MTRRHVATLLPCVTLLAWAVDAHAVGNATSAEVRSSVREELSRQTYTFCHDADFPLSGAERAYCPLLGSSSSLCPELPAACKNDKVPEMSFVEEGPNRGRRYVDTAPADGSGRTDGRSGGGSRDGAGSGSGRGGDGSDGGAQPGGSGGRSSGDGASGRGGDGASGRGGDGASGRGDRGGGRGTGQPGGQPGADPKEAAKPPPPPPPPKPEPEPLTVPGWLIGLAKALFYLLIAAFVLGLGYIIVKNVLKGRDAEADEDEGDDPAPTEELAATPRGPIETDVDRLLKRSQAAAARGDFKQAIEDAYAALLRRLEGDGVIALHPSRTNGDYVRQMRDRAELRQAVRGIATDVESVQFGSAPASPTLFESVYRRVLPLVGRAAVLLAVCLGLGAQTSCAEQRALAVGAAPQGSSAPLGRQAVFALLQRHDHEVTVHRDAELTLEEPRTIVLLPDAPVDERTLRKLVRWVDRKGGHLIVAGHREELEEELPVRFGDRGAEAPVRPAAGAPTRLSGHELGVPRFGRLLPDLEKDPGLRVLLERTESSGAEAYAVVRAYPSGGQIVLFADDALFKNIALPVKDNAVFLAALFQELDHTPVEFWDGFTSAGSDAESQRGAASPLDSIEQSRLGPVMLHLLALVILYLLYKGTRFGTPRDPRTVSRRSFADHARALGLTYARGKASHHALGLYAVWAIERLRERFGRSRERGLIPLAEAIGERVGRPPGQVMQVLVEATSARDEVAPPSSYRPGGARPEPESAGQAAGPARDFWVMRQLEGFLAATYGRAAKPKSTTREGPGG